MLTAGKISSPLPFLIFTSCIFHLLTSFNSMIVQNANLGREASGFPCQQSSLLRIRAGFVFNSAIYLFGGHTNNNAQCWMVRLRESNKSRFYAVDTDYPKPESKWVNEDFQNFTQFTGCPSAALMVNQTLYLFKGSNVYTFTSSPFVLTTVTTFRSLLSLNPAVIEIVAALVVKKLGPRFLVKITTRTQKFVRFQRLLYLFEHKDILQGYSLPQLQKQEYVSEVALTNMWHTSTSTFGYHFLEDVSIPSEYRINRGEVNLKLYSEHALLVGSLRNKGYNSKLVMSPPPKRPYDSYIVPLESWFGCPLDRFCLFYQLDGIVNLGNTFKVFLDKHIYTVARPTDRLTDSPSLLSAEFGGLVSSYVDAVIGLPPTNATKIYIFKDTTFYIHDLETNKSTARSINEVFDRDNKVIAAVALEDDIGYLYDNDGNNAKVKKYSGISFRVDIKAIFSGQKTVSQVNNILPANLDTVFQNGSQIITTFKQLFTSQPVTSFYDQQFAGNTFSLFAKGKLFGCNFNNFDSYVRSMLNSYENALPPNPANGHVLLPNETTLPTTAVTTSEKTKDRTSSRGIGIRKTSHIDIPIETLSPSPTVILGFHFLVAAIAGFAGLVLLGLLMGFVIYYATMKRKDFNARKNVVLLRKRADHIGPKRRVLRIRRNA